MTFGLEVQRAILCAHGSSWYKTFLAEHSFDLQTSGLWSQLAFTGSLCYPFLPRAGTEFHSYCGQEAKVLFVLDHSAKLTVVSYDWQPQSQAMQTICKTHNMQAEFYVGYAYKGSLAQLVRASC